MRAEAANRSGAPGENIQGFRTIAVELKKLTSDFYGALPFQPEKQALFFELLDKLISLLTRELQKRGDKYDPELKSLLELFVEGKSALVLMHSHMGPLLVSLEEHCRIIRKPETMRSERWTTEDSELFHRIIKARNLSYMNPEELILDEYLAAAKAYLSSEHLESLLKGLSADERGEWESALEAATVKLEALVVLR